MPLNVKSNLRKFILVVILCIFCANVTLAQESIVHKNYKIALNILINNIRNTATTKQAKFIMTAITTMWQDNRNIDPNTQGKFGYNLLILASMIGQLEVITILLADERTNPNIQDIDAGTALIRATSENQPAVVAALLADKRTDPNIQDCYGNTALNLASEEITKILLGDERTDPNIQNYSDWTPLMYASLYGYTGIVKALLANPKINVNIKNSEGLTAYQIAMYAGHREIAKLCAF